MQQYRADIDGLRALAVVAVVMFHAGIPGFHGGFVGVDVFFVISGFLITNFILSDLRQSTFSIWNFYERRIRRIFPALFTMMLVCGLAAYWLLLPRDFAEFGTSAAWATLFASNIHFWQQSSYFSGAAEFRPLLHTWSLAIEEQFYILYPIAVAIVFRFARNKICTAIVLCLCLSFAVSAWAAMTHPHAAFYLTPSRAWELLLGALLALDVLPKIVGPKRRNAATVLGLLFILGSIFVYTAATPFPGLAAALPCVGTALIIHGGTTGATGVGRILSLRPIVFVGLISYSLYLWHWPVLVMFRHYMSVNDLPPLVTAVAIVLSIGLAVLSWRYVEQPFRRRHRIGRRTVVVAGTGAVAAMLAIGVVVPAFDGLPHRFNDAVIRLAAAGQDISRDGRACINRKTPDDVRQGDLCESIGASTPTQSFLLWGDSHAAALVPAINKAAARAGRSGLMAMASGCPPLIGITSPSGLRKFPCLDFNRAVLKTSLARDEIKTVILKARWAFYAHGSTYEIEARRNIVIADDESKTPSMAENEMVFVRGLRRSLAALTKAGKRVVIVGPTPEIGWTVPRTLAMQQYTRRYWPIAPTYAEYMNRQAFVVRTLIALAAEYGAELIFPHTVLCDEKTCSVREADQILYSDNNHLSFTGADSISRLFEPIF